MKLVVDKVMLELAPIHSVLLSSRYGVSINTLVIILVEVSSLVTSHGCIFTNSKLFFYYRRLEKTA
jgi:hypothetical protein